MLVSSKKSGANHNLKSLAIKKIAVKYYKSYTKLGTVSGSRYRPL